MFKFDLLENEKMIAIYRQTEAKLFKPVIVVFILIYFPWYFLLKYGLADSYDRLLLFWTILVLAYAVYKYLLWLLNVCLVTNKRVVVVNYISLFNKKVTECPQSRILNVSFTVKGFWGTLFGFGAVQVRADGLSEAVVLQNIAHPSKVKDFLWETHNKFSGKI